jgi:hypothetical protein
LLVTLSRLPHLNEGNEILKKSSSTQGENKMKTNESALDRVIRVILGFVLIGLYLLGYVAGGLGIVLVVLGAILLITGLVGFCPLYKLFKFSTKKA